MWSGFEALTGLFPTQVLATAGAPRGPSTRAPASEGSGLIDIRAMQALIGGRSGGESKSASASQDEQLPSFGGGFNGLSATPLLTPTPVAAAPVQRPPAPSRMLYMLAGVLGMGILGLGALMLQKPPDREPVVAAAPAPVVETQTDEVDANAAPEPERVDEPSLAVEAEAAEPEPAVEAGKPPKPRARSRSNKQPSGTSPAKVSTTPTSPAPKTGESVDVDCLLNKNLPKCKQGSSKPGVDDTDPEPTKPKPAEELPNKLSSSQISTGLAPVKTAAKSCGSGTTVEIKFSVTGASGQVVSATPLGEHASTSVGQCVAKAAKAASFPKFSAGQQGFSFKFRL